MAAQSRLPGTIERHIYNFIDQARGFSVAFRSSYGDAVAEDMSKLTDLSGLDSDERSRIWVTINDAAQCFHSVHWQPLFDDAIRGRRGLRLALIIGQVLPMAIFFGLFLPKPIVSGVAVNSIFIGAMAACYMIMMGGMLMARISRRISLPILVISGFVGFTEVGTFHRWAPYVPNAWRNLALALWPIHLKVRTQMASLPIAHSLQVLAWVLAVASAVAAFRAIVPSYFAYFVCPGGSSSGTCAARCSEMIIQLLRISYSLDATVSRIQDTAGGTRRIIEFPSVFERNEIESSLNQLACLARGPWPEAMRSNYGLAGRWSASQVPNIEFFFQRQQARNILAGSNLFDLRDSMATALIRAADGDWDLIYPREEYAHVTVSGSWKIRVRKGTAIVLPIVGAIVAIRLLKNFPASYVSTIVITCIGFSGFQVLSLIDPNAAALVDVASKIATIFRRGGS